MSASLLIDGPGSWAFHFDLSNKQEIFFGRSSQNDIRIPDDRISGRHGCFVLGADTWSVRDLKSSNGTFVNGSRVAEMPLKNGDVVRVGDSDIVFRDRSKAPDDDVWGKTAMRINMHETAIRGALRRAGQDEVVVIPDLHLLPSTVQTVSMGVRGTDSQFEVQEFDSDRFEPKKFSPQGDDVTREDMLWIAERLADILGATALQQHRGTTEIYTEVLRHLQASINAENGFIMIPDRQTRKWVITAHVGDAANWTEYEKQRPVPLTIANRAFNDDKVVTNAFGPEQVKIDTSKSMMQLNVQFFIAVPLHRNGNKDGLLYFDTRKGMTPFRPRDVKLLERVGSYILELNRVVS